MEGELPAGTTATATATAEEEEGRDKVRLYVGGVGENVTRDDMSKIFGWLGSIDTVDFVRTKGRSFAYVDFRPSSTNSLSKLFTTYNGCVWKGGKLRLERAKEDYLTRLRREWKEDSEAAIEKNDADDDDVVLDSDVAKKELNSENKKLRIFFPALRKVKLIPYSGTGKHKYSFRRVDARLVPKYFCDCEEHSDPLDIQKGEKNSGSENLGRGVDEKEVELMNAVMSKIFRRENVLDSQNAVIDLDEKIDNHVESVDDVHDQGGTEEDSNGDEDNLIINMVSQPQEFRNNRSNFKDTSMNSKLKEQQNRPGSHNRERKPIMNKENNAKTSRPGSSVVPEISGSLEAHSDVLHRSSEGQSIGKKSTPGISWSQKSSWKELVGNKGVSAFSISDILPGISSTNKEDPCPSSVLASSISKAKKRKHESKVLQSGASGEEEPTTDGVSFNDISKKRKLKHKRKVDLLDKGTEIERQVDQLEERTEVERLAEQLDKETEAERQGKSQSMEREYTSMSERGLEHKKRGDHPDEASGEEKLAESQQMEHDSGIMKSKNEPTVDRQTGQLSKTVDDNRTAQSQPLVQGSLSKNSGRGSAWLHESSWTQLVAGNQSSSSFSISQVLPGITFENKGPETHDTLCNSNEHHNALEKMESNPQKLATRRSDNLDTPAVSEQKVVGNGKATAQTTSNTSAIKKTFTPAIAISETCPFMRTSASMKEWANTKAALSGGRKRKDEK